MIRPISKGPIAIVLPTDQQEPRTVFVVRQISAEDWDAFAASKDVQLGGKTGAEGARLEKQQLRAMVARYVDEIRNAYEEGDSVTDCAAYFADMTPVAFQALVNALTGLGDITMLEKKA